MAEDGLWDTLPVPFIGTVAEDFDGEEGELSLKEGTLVVVVQCDEDGWFTLHTKVGSGIFPGSYVDALETIDLPIVAKVIKNFPELGLKVGQTVTVQDISIDGWMVEAGNDIGYTTWNHLQIEPEVLINKNQVNPDVDLDIPDFMDDRPANNNRAAGSLFAVNPIRVDSAVVEPKPLQGNNAKPQQPPQQAQQPPQQVQQPVGHLPKGQGGSGRLSVSQGQQAGPPQVHKPPAQQPRPGGPQAASGQAPQGQRPGGPQAGGPQAGGQQARPQQQGGGVNNPRMTMPPGQPAQQVQKQANPNPALQKPNQSLPSKEAQQINNKPVGGIKPSNARVHMTKQALAGTQTIAKRDKPSAKPGEMHESQFATYRRPTSVFADVIKENKAFDEKLNIYSIRQANKGRMIFLFLFRGNLLY